MKKSVLYGVLGALLIPLGMMIMTHSAHMLSAQSDMEVYAGWVMAVLGVAILGIGGAIVVKKMVSKFGKTTALGLVAVLSLGSCSERIDAGHVGMRVSDYGDQKGVNDVAEVTGRVWYNPFTETVIEFPTFVQNVTYDAAGEHHQELRVTDKDGMVIAFDLRMSYHVPANAAAPVFRKYRRPFDELQYTVLYGYVQEAFSTVASNYTASELYEKRAQFQTEASGAVIKILQKEGFMVDQLSLVNELRLPESVVKNIEAKVSATQMALRKEAELQQAQADAAKAVAHARGDSASRVIMAAGEAEAYQLIKKELTPEMVQLKAIDKWNGTLPVTNASGAMPFINLK